MLNYKQICLMQYILNLFDFEITRCLENRQNNQIISFKYLKDNKENYSNNGDIISSIIEKRNEIDNKQDCEIENNQDSEKKSTTIETFFKNLVEYPNDKIFEDSNFKKILDKSWKRLPSFIYNGLLLLYVMFLVFYSIYISEYKQLSSSWNTSQIIYSKNFMECITYSLGFLTIFLDYSQTNLILISCSRY
ncbi:hypothetical protein BpHYR1_039277 [Brachionus plicatilis]|uniref:Uncharacterized protein n=1 Tax=Brachionus plicatilis TaxID=10195 RepID=A0A3M7PT43_BRAPC|nr:hypothetical protein BpHYR1_039277 [Brachionus plicatilis]